MYFSVNPLGLKGFVIIRMVFYLLLLNLRGGVWQKGQVKKVLQATFSRFWAKYDGDYVTKADVVRKVFGSHVHYGGGSWPGQMMSS